MSKPESNSNSPDEQATLTDEDPSSAPTASSDAFAATAAPVTEPSGAPSEAGHLAHDPSFPQERYHAQSVLGVGGMGEVHLCTDRTIGRDVAIKLVRPEIRKSGIGYARFVREAKVQARLEHPAVVPVYDLGVSGEGAAWFSMKRVRGRTLDRIVHALARGEEARNGNLSQRRLLTAFVQVCLAVDYAHENGILHRDLKPANIMLGDFGEVNVLDWGLAKVMGADEESLPSLSDLVGSGDHQTVHGSLMGTPGYMAPEQAKGEEEIDHRADIYALGCILFELVCLEPLHRGNSVPALLSSTVMGAEARAEARGHTDVPPELEAAWLGAIGLEPVDRFASARELAQAVERYLDGDRDTARRRELAGQHLETARGLLLPDGEGAVAASARAGALRELGRAVALDPENAEALDMLAHVLIEAPEEMPAEAEAQYEEARDHARRSAFRGGTLRVVLWLTFVPLVVWMGIRSWPLAGSIIGFMALSAAAFFWVSRRSAIRDVHTATLLLVSSVTIALMSVVFGPFILVPGLAATNALFFCVYASNTRRIWVVSASVAAVVLPFLLELGAVPDSYGFGEGLLLVLPRGVAFPPLPTTTTLLVSSVFMVIIPAFLAGRLRDALASAERRLFLQAWHLSQLVPKEARQGLLSAHRRLTRSIS